jgi:acyl carrier protein
MTIAAASKEDIELFVYDALVEFGAERETIDHDASFEDLEIDSLDLVDLGQALKKRFALGLRPKDFEDVVTVGDALGLIYDKAGLT